MIYAVFRSSNWIPIEFPSYTYSNIIPLEIKCKPIIRPELLYELQRIQNLVLSNLINLYRCGQLRCKWEISIKHEGKMEASEPK